jgi:hypothetical protein
MNDLQICSKYVRLKSDYEDYECGLGYSMYNEASRASKILPV